MKIVVVSDTHMPSRGSDLPSVLKKELEDADIIIHAGDWNTKDVFVLLKEYGEVDGVHGNTDTAEIKALFPEKKVIEAKGFKIGIVHGHGSGKTTEKRALEAFEERPDIIIFGHSHIPYLRFAQGVLLFNPGSATDKRRQPYYSYGVLEVDEAISARHVFYKDKVN